MRPPNKSMAYPDIRAIYTRRACFGTTIYKIRTVSACRGAVGSQTDALKTELRGLCGSRRRICVRRLFEASNAGLLPACSSCRLGPVDFVCVSRCPTAVFYGEAACTAIRSREAPERRAPLRTGNAPSSCWQCIQASRIDRLSALGAGPICSHGNSLQGGFNLKNFGSLSLAYNLECFLIFKFNGLVLGIL